MDRLDPPGKTPVQVISSASRSGRSQGRKKPPATSEGTVVTSSPLPNWAREVVTLCLCGHFLLSGNVRDQYFVGSAEGGDVRAGPPLRSALVGGVAR